MHDVQPRPVRTGSDPRSLSEFVTLREEMNKLTHPARPDVDWSRVENLSLALFEHNGVELQTAAWYTLAKTTTSSANGMREGLAILNTLISHQWSVMWPPQVHVRMAIISGLSQRLQKVFRTLTLTYDDLSALYDCGRLLEELGEALSRQGQKQAGQLDGLCHQITQSVTRLEKNAPQNEPETDMTYLSSGSFPEIRVGTLPDKLPGDSPESSPAGTEHPALVYVVHSAPSVAVSVEPNPADIIPPPKRWPAFLAGMMLACTLCGVALTGYHVFFREDAVSQGLASTVAPLPMLLTAEQLGTLQHDEARDILAPEWLTEAGPLLNTLATQPPDWSLRYGEQLLAQAKTLWPDNKEVAALSRQWKQQLATNTMVDTSLKGWYQGMARLNALSDRLNELDRQKGKYLTVSELKSQVFGMLTSFQQAIPLEEQLRQIKLLPADSPQRQQQIRQAEQHLRAQTYMLAQEKVGD